PESPRWLCSKGREAEARRLLALISADPDAPQGISASASSALLGVLIAERKPEQAESLLKVMLPTQSLDDRERDARRVAFAWALSGDVARGEALVSSDSSVTGMALRGVLRAFTGDLVTASAWLEAAGPYDEQRENSVERVRLLALLQLIDRDTLPALGESLLTLARGDTVVAIDGLIGSGESLAGPAQAALRHYAGELALARGDTSGAMEHLRLADTIAAPASAPAARLLMARILTARGRTDQAETLLEQLIMDFPDSAVVPAARRMRDANRGAVPGTVPI
ncbi:MAG TPA: tetratricopeptide repeat protein, partial [Gemmatimonadales bacterium]|nr:tetratricopeptide repeat protein [Gemmatimonadales bacterium]